MRLSGGSAGIGVCGLLVILIRGVISPTAELRRAAAVMLPCERPQLTNWDRCCFSSVLRGEESEKRVCAAPSS